MGVGIPFPVEPGQARRAAAPRVLVLFFITLGLDLGDTKVYEP